MRLDEFAERDQPEVGDIIEVEVGDELVETMIIAVDQGDYICETDNDTGLALLEAEYHGHKVKLNKPSKGDVKKYKVFVRNPKTGRITKIDFGELNTGHKGSRARHGCGNPGPRTRAKYWSCRKW